MLILSIDVGILNFAYCIMDSITQKIIHWNILTLCNKTEIENCRDLVKQLDQRPEMLQVTLILIERQPKQNPKMRILSETVRTYFIIRSVDRGVNIRVQNWSPKYKLKCCNNSKLDPTELSKIIRLKSSYQQRKKLSIAHCKLFLLELDQDERFIKLFENSKKKDDLADAFLQVYSYCVRGKSNNLKDTSTKTE
jgi:hypothetical protein